jgi:ribosomal protein L20
MTRVKSAAQRNHRRTLKAAKGFKQARSKRIKVAKEAVMHAGQYAYEGRKHKKRDFKKIWVLRISAATKKAGMSYSKFIGGLKKNKIELNRKILSELATNYPKVFSQIIEEAKK